ncbi:MAG: V-type ATP synthase subunit D [Clostridiaceae bacterium]|jgi:V/A-type H+-transporting ATPase subunit D|nr:V-type ATP synthase subunit D [Clostridiaceae bacterium]
MARLNVNPTRMVLTGLKKRLKTAIRGHKLLKDKRDELMKKFLDIVRENKRLREEMEEKLMVVHSRFVMARAVMNTELVEEALMFPKIELNLKAKTRNIMSVNVPVLEFTTGENIEGDIYPYGFAYTTGELDEAIATLSALAPDLLKLAEMEKSAQLLADEIEKTRRRVNALEYVMIPNLQETIKYITMKLEENERSNLTRLMKVKDMMLEKAHHYKARRGFSSG